MARHLKTPTPRPIWVGMGAIDTHQGLGTVFEDLSTALWRLRAVTDQAVFCVDVLQSLLESGRPQHLARLTADLELVSDDLRQVELVRAMLAQIVTDLLLMPSGTRMVDLTEDTPEPWRSELAKHRNAISGMIAHLDQTCARWPDEGAEPDLQRAMDAAGSIAPPSLRDFLE
ncbi:hypothetical protein [Euzebya tangerina]|uniref:hypothetical protein n=1 Tax=Euzebya tangerina TaxID=591198 RepID=UPI000E322649|nr:hypothetical protein [Euzebya tangerina]